MRHSLFYTVLPVEAGKDLMKWATPTKETGSEKEFVPDSLNGGWEPRWIPPQMENFVFYLSPEINASSPNISLLASTTLQDGQRERAVFLKGTHTQNQIMGQ